MAYDHAQSRFACRRAHRGRGILLSLHPRGRLQNPSGCFKRLIKANIPDQDAIESLTKYTAVPDEGPHEYVNVTWDAMIRSLERSGVQWVNAQAAIFSKS